MGKSTGPEGALRLECDGDGCGVHESFPAGKSALLWSETQGRVLCRRCGAAPWDAAKRAREHATMRADSARIRLQGAVRAMLEVGLDPDAVAKVRQAHVDCVARDAEASKAMDAWTEINIEIKPDAPASGSAS